MQSCLNEESALLKALGLIGHESWQLDPEQLESLMSGEKHYAFLHLGYAKTPMSKVLESISSSSISPPRSGHMGNWGDIVVGRSGAMDFNYFICLGGYGHPSIFCFNQTETKALDGGDTVYVPGSLVKQGKQSMLELYAWDGQQFALCDRTSPRFVPFLKAKSEQGLKPLTSLLTHQLREQLGTFELEVDLLAKHRERLSAWIEALIRAALTSNNPARLLQDLVGHAATLSGDIERAKFSLEGNSIVMNGIEYSPEDFADLIWAPIIAVNEPQHFFSNMEKWPVKLPIISHLLVAVFSALCRSHFVCNTNRGDFGPTIHFHWGARAMGGFPPARKGYFAEKSTAKSLRHIMATIDDVSAEPISLVYVVMPAPVFMLCPTNLKSNDAQVLEGLFSHIFANFDPLECSESLGKKLNALVHEWLQRNGQDLSSYFTRRFNGWPGLLDVDSAELDVSDHLLSKAWQALTIEQLCIVVGTFHEYYGRNDD
jgi:hypothetical protein